MSLLTKASMVMTPNAIKESKVYSIIPSNGNGDLDFTRGTLASSTLNNASGLIETVPYNLLNYSEQFDQSYWTKINLNIISNSIISPNGTKSASTYIPLLSPSQLTLNTISKQTVNITYTYSFYVKSSGLSDIRCFIYGVSNANRGEATFNVINGTISNVISVGAFSNTTATINLVNNNYYLCTITTTSDISSGINVNIRHDNAVSGSSGFYIWGAQLVQGSIPKDYFFTTDRLNVPRLNYDSVGGCPSLLLEPQRTNLALRSEEFENPYWIKVASGVGSISITSNYSTSPSGAITADRLLANNVGATTISSAATTVTNGFSYTISIYAKSNTSNSYTYALREGYSGTVSSNFSITPTWQRFNLTFTAIGIIAELQLRTLVIGTSDISIWGAQLEQGAYPTSYIPTTTSATTRNQDVCSKSGISDLIGQTEGTMYLDFAIGTSVNFESDIRISSPQNGIAFYNVGLRPTISVQSANVTTLNTATALDNMVIGVSNKIAIAYKNNDFAVYQNGVLKLTQNSGNVPILLSDITLSSGPRFNSIKGVILFKTRLTNTELQQLTTL